MAQSVFLLHKLHGGASLICRANRGDVRRRAPRSRSAGSPHLTSTRRARAALNRSARRHVRKPVRFVVATTGSHRAVGTYPFRPRHDTLL
jgi:hypothetical protein